MPNDSNPKKSTVVTLVVAVAILTCLFAVAQRQSDIQSRERPPQPFTKAAPPEAPPLLLEPALRRLDSVTQHG